MRFDLIILLIFLLCIAASDYKRAVIPDAYILAGITFRILATSKVSFQSGDVFIVHSVSGRNPVALEMAEEAKKKGATVIAITNVAFSKSVSSRHPNGRKLYQLGDIVLDNHGNIGDACISVDGLQQKVGPTSTVIGAIMVNSIVSALTQRLVEKGLEKPPIYYSANLDGGDELNRQIYEEYKDVIHYKL